MKRSIIRFTAKTLILVLAYELVLPATQSFALTSGPSQPEVESFEPVGTTDMVNLFTGDFVYNIPLLDVDGYPINISYHAGANIEQEASWVGLGWNLNPGEVNRGLRGIPDDFKGDSLMKFYSIKNEKDYRLRIGANVGFEAFGALNLGIGAGQFITYNNYKGMGIGFDVNAGFSTPNASNLAGNGGVGITVGSQDGASIDASVGVGFKTSKNLDENVGGISVSGGTGFNTRSGLKDIGVNFNMSISNTQKSNYKDLTKKVKNDIGYTSTSQGGLGFGSSIPIGLQNHVAVVTNASTMKAFSIRVKLGLEAMFTFPHFNTTVTMSELAHKYNGSMPSFGYMYNEFATPAGIMDFSREKDGIYNSSLPNLPISSMTYDVYSVNGQGTGGSFRPFRSDIGTVYDPFVSSTSSNDNVGLEFGTGIGPVGGLFELGADATFFRSKIESGPGYYKPFTAGKRGSLYEPVYLKQGGELTYNIQQDHAALSSRSPLSVSYDGVLRDAGGNSQGNLPSTFGAAENRSARANFMSYLLNSDLATVWEHENGNPTFHDSLRTSFPEMQFVNFNANIKNKARAGAKANKAKEHHIGKVIQTLADGRRYVYGLPAMNNVQKEVTFSVNPANSNEGSGLVKFVAGTTDTRSNGEGRENFFQTTYTPAYAYSYLITEALSQDYVDIGGDGPTEDDLGTYTKFNYSLSDSDYRWIAPYQALSGSDSAQYIPGFRSDDGDDKGQYVLGSKEIWHLHTIESKNFVAEFYTSNRQDALGTQQAAVRGTDFEPTSPFDAFLGTGKASASINKKLDSIKLFNKNDRLTNGASAVPIKTVIFQYDQTLCPGAPNRSAGAGKLTLKRIYFRYGNSDRSLLNPYVFTYDETFNKPYGFADKDRWGNYKLNNTAFPNHDFPYVIQNKGTTDVYASSWHLTEVRLPSGGRLKVSYESDDYSYVQDKRSMEMTKIAGVGSSPSFIPQDQLYENEDRVCEYIYFQRDAGREVAGRSMREWYLDGTDLLYFSFNLDIAAKNKYEQIKGYARVTDVGVCPNDAGYGYFKVVRESAGGNSPKLLNPITLAGLNSGRYYLPHVIYPGFTNGDANLSEALRGLAASVNELLTISQNPNVRFVKNGLAKKIAINKSFIRTHSPGFTKLGGGSRVKEIRLDDSWNLMTGVTGAEAQYGRTYTYETTGPWGNPISSGVASYEPLIGGDENPMRVPVPYTAAGGRLLPSIEFYQETPYGESFFPPPVVGYSKVTVKSIHRDIARSSRSEEVHEFYTAKDFPVETEFTDKQTPLAKRHRTLTNKEEHMQVMQGYVLRLNDMHGKPKAMSNYAVKADNVNKELVTATRYHYQVNNQGKLDNTVKAVKRSSLVNPSYSVANIKLGEEVDFTVDSRKRVMENFSINVNFNLNVVNFAFISIPIPTVFFPDVNEKNIFETLVATKIIQQYGLLKSVEHIDHGARTVSENLLYDSETGQVLLSKVNNEFGDPVHNLSYPAYWAYDNMGGAYYNVGYEHHFDKAVIDNCIRVHLRGAVDPRHFNRGDELLMRYSCLEAPGDTATYEILGWVAGTGKLPEVPACSVGPSFVEDCTIIVEPRSTNPGGHLTWLWFMGGTELFDIHVKVVRSGRRNMLSSSVQTLAIAGPMDVSSLADLFASPSFSAPVTGASNIVATSTTVYGDRATNNEFGTNWYNHNFGFSQYIKGEKGNPKPWTSHAYVVDRTNNLHSRTDGKFKSYAPFWKLGKLGVDSLACSMEDYLLIPSNNAGWKKLSEAAEYDAYGHVVEARDAALVPSASLYGHNYTLPLAIGHNAKRGQLVFVGFEDLLQVTSRNIWRYGMKPTLRQNDYPLYEPTNYVNNYGRSYVAPQAGHYVPNAVVTSAERHTGKYSMLTSGTALIPIAQLANFTGVPYCQVSLWVKKQSGEPSASDLKVRATTPVSSSSDYTLFTVKTRSIDGWFKLEGKMTMNPLSSYTDVNLVVPAGYYVDDIRMAPDNTDMKSFVYDPFTYRLMAELDENNFATFYEYDQEGGLVRVKKESERGILTLKEHRISRAKGLH
jgi:hypothetical protein